MLFAGGIFTSSKRTVGCLGVQGEKTSKWVGGTALKGLRECSNWRQGGEVVGNRKEN